MFAILYNAKMKALLLDPFHSQELVSTLIPSAAAYSGADLFPPVSPPWPTLECNGQQHSHQHHPASFAVDLAATQRGGLLPGYP